MLVSGTILLNDETAPTESLDRSGSALLEQMHLSLEGWCARGDLNPHVLSNTGT